MNVSRIDNFFRRAREPARCANWRRALFLALSLLTCCHSGCQIVTGLMLIAQGRPEVDSDFEVRTRQSLAKKGKQVLVLCTAPEEVAREFSAVDLDLNAVISRKLSNHKIKLVDPQTAARWMEDHGGEVEDLAEIATDLKADYVVQIRLEQFNYQDPASPGLFQGKTQAKVQVFEFTPTAADGKLRTSRRIYSTPFTLKYPSNQPVPSDRQSASVFRKRFTDEVGDRIAKLFYDHRPDEDFDK